MKKKVLFCGFYKVFAAIVFVFFCSMIFSASASAENIKTYSMTATLEQTTAREMLKSINSFRTGKDAWYYDTNGGKVSVSGLGKLQYDYDLEQVAIQRAYEVAVSFSHTRPDGTSCFTCTYNGTSSCGENIAAGYSTADSVFVGWREDNDDYYGQGHRRNMLGGYTSIGIGHVVYNGVHYWVQEFGYTTDSQYTAPTNASKSRDIDIDISSATFTFAMEKTSLSSSDGETGKIPGMTGYLKTSSTWGSKGLKVPSSAFSSKKWTSSDTSVIVVDSKGKYTFVGPGSATVTCTGKFNGTKYTGTVNVTSNVTAKTSKVQWVEENGKWYYMNPATGEKTIGWKKIDNRWYFFKSSGEMATGWVKDGGKWYYMNSNGSMKTGWLQDGGKWYYMNSQGYMKTGWLNLDNKWFYLNSNGTMKTGWLQDAGKWYYFNNSGVMQTGWKKLDGKWYYFDSKGIMATGTKKIDGKTYRFDSKGACLNP